MRIYIPTYKRVDNQITFENLPEEIQKNVIMVVQQQERDQYKYDCEYLVVGNDIGIAKTRELIYQHAGLHRFGIMDDDLRLFRRNAKYMGEESNMETSRRLMNLDDWNYWLSEVHRLFDDKNVMHIGHRDVSLPPYGQKYFHFKPILAVHWIDGLKLSKFIDEVDWNLAQIGEDLVLTLECLQRGYLHYISDEVAMTRWETAFAEGGCAEFRTSEVNDAEMMKIAKKYAFVTPLNQYDEYKGIGRVRKFKTNLKDAYNSYSTRTLEEFLY